MTLQQLRRMCLEVARDIEMLAVLLADPKERESEATKRVRDSIKRNMNTIADGWAEIRKKTSSK